MGISVRADFSQALRKLEQLPDKVQEKAVIATINRVAAKAKTEMKRQIGAEFNLKSTDINAQLRVSKANKSQTLVQAVLSSFGKRRGHTSRNVMMFDARQVVGTGRPKAVRVQFKDGSWRTLTIREGGGVSVNIKRNGGRKLIPHAFIANKGRTVFIRNEDGTIKGVETIDIPNMFNTKRIYANVLEKIRTDLIAETDRSLKFFGR